MTQSRHNYEPFESLARLVAKVSLTESMGNLRRQLLIHLIVFVQMAHRMVNGVALPQDENYGKTWMYFPDGDGNILVANLTNEAFRIRAEPILGDISFELYTQQDFTVTGEQESRQDGAWQDFRTSFQPDLETKVLIHGWESDTQSAFVQSVKNNYLQSRECNIIGKPVLKVIRFKFDNENIFFNCISKYSYCVAIEES